jgi:hypothetical protein
MVKRPTAAGSKPRGWPAVGRGWASITSGSAFTRCVRRVEPKKSTLEISVSMGVTVRRPGCRGKRALRRMGVTRYSRPS